MSAADGFLCVFLAVTYTTMLRDMLATAKNSRVRLLLACPAWLLLLLAPCLMYGDVRSAHSLVDDSYITTPLGLLKGACRATCRLQGPWNCKVVKTVVPSALPELANHICQTLLNTKAAHLTGVCSRCY